MVIMAACAMLLTHIIIIDINFHFVWYGVYCLSAIEKFIERTLNITQNFCAALLAISLTDGV